MEQLVGIGSGSVTHPPPLQLPINLPTPSLQLCDLAGNVGEVGLECCEVGGDGVEVGGGGLRDIFQKSRKGLRERYGEGRGVCQLWWKVGMR